MSPRDTSAPPREATDRKDGSALFGELDALDEHVDDEDAREQLREVEELASDMQTESGTLGRVVCGFDANDLAEAFLGGLLFGVPMAVECGTNEAGEFVAMHPMDLRGSLAATVVIVDGLLYVARFRDVRVADPFSACWRGDPSASSVRPRPPRWCC